MEYRYRYLPQALERAKEVDCAGACYPLTTLDGTESCTGGSTDAADSCQRGNTLRYLALYASFQDKDFLYTHGIEVLLQISRYFASRGQWSQLTGEFGFYGVMGADELQIMAHNNCYTNIMAKKTFEIPCKVFD